MIGASMEGVTAARRAGQGLRRGLDETFEEDPGSFAPLERLLVLEQLQNVSSDPNHLGDRAIQADFITHSKIESFLKRFNNKIIIAGEEGLSSMSSVLNEAPDGALAIDIDAIDGTRPYRTIGLGWCVVLHALLKYGDRWRHEAAVIMGENGRYLFADRNWQVSVGDTFIAPYLQYDNNEIVVTDPGELLDDIPPTLAIVGAKSKDRLIWTPIIEYLPNWTIFTVGGNPIARGFITEELCATILFEHTTVFDSIFVPIVAAVGYKVSLLSGTEIPLDELREWWDFIGFGNDAKIIPPIIVSRSEFLEELVNAVRSSGLDHGSM